MKNFAEQTIFHDFGWLCANSRVLRNRSLFFCGILTLAKFFTLRASPICAIAASDGDRCTKVQLHPAFLALAQIELVNTPG